MLLLWCQVSRCQCWNVSLLPGATVNEAGRSSLLIENMTTSDAGTYVCIAENSVGSIRALSFVRVRGTFVEQACSGAFLQVSRS